MRQVRAFAPGRKCNNNLWLTQDCHWHLSFIPMGFPLLWKPRPSPPLKGGKAQASSGEEPPSLSARSPKAGRLPAKQVMYLSASPALKPVRFNAGLSSQVTTR